MQGTVFSFDPDSGAGSVVLDTGQRLGFDGDVFAASGLRLLRSGQRVQLSVDDERITAITIVTLTIDDHTG